MLQIFQPLALHTKHYVRFLADIYLVYTANFLQSCKYNELTASFSGSTSQDLISLAILHYSCFQRHCKIFQSL